jgi:hypothetical protein
MIKRLERLKNTVNKYMADIRPDRLTTCLSERKSVVSRRPSVFFSDPTFGCLRSKEASGFLRIAKRLKEENGSDNNMKMNFRQIV